jgi:MFS family permease
MGVQVSPSVMASQLMRDLNIGTLGLGVMSGFYFYTYAIMQVPSGLLHDRFSPRIIIVISIMVCAIGSLMFGLSQNIFIGSLARLLMGGGSAFAFVSVLVIIFDLFQSKYFAFLTGITQMLAAFGAILGQTPLSKLVEFIGWRNTMFVLAAIGFILAFVTFSFIKYKRNASSSTLAVNSFNLTNSFKIILSNQQTWYIALYAFLLWVPMSGFASLWGVPYLEKVYKLNHAAASGVCSLMWFGLALFSPILGWLSTLIGRRTIPLVFSAFLGSVAFVVVILFSNLPGWLLGIVLFLAGAGCAGQALSFSVVKENNLRYMRATAIGVNNMAMVISGAIVQPLMGKLLQFHVSFMSSFKLSMLIILFSYIAAVLVSWLKINETYCLDVTKN